METNGLLGACIVATATLTAFCFSFYVVKHAHRQKLSLQAKASLLGDEKEGISLVRNGIPWMNVCAEGLLHNQRINLFFKDLRWFLSTRGIPATPKGLCSLSCLMLLVESLIVAVLATSAALGVAVAIITVLVIKFFLAHKKELQKTEMRESVPDILRSMSACSQAGLSLQQSFEHISEEVTGPFKKIFKRVVHDLKTGKTMTEALSLFGEEIEIDELRFIAVALDVQHRCGGGLQQVLDSARDSVESELELRRSLRVQTAQAKLSARIVSLMPFVLVILFSIISPGFLEPFFQSFLGFILLAAAIGMQVGGVLLVRRILKVEVD